MAVNGERFLRLSRAEALHISRHALDRIDQHVGRYVGREEALDLFCRGTQVRAEGLLQLGYRPAYAGRLARGQRSWYFRFGIEGTELIAVIGQGMLPGEYVWLTTYGRNRQTDQYQVATFEDVSLAAMIN